MGDYAKCETCRHLDTDEIAVRGSRSVVVAFHCAHPQVGSPTRIDPAVHYCAQHTPDATAGGDHG